MPSKSVAQRRMMGMALAMKRGEMEPMEGPAHEAMESMKEEQLEDYAKTKESGLPQKVRKMGEKGQRKPKGRMGKKGCRRTG